MVGVTLPRLGYETECQFDDNGTVTPFIQEDFGESCFATHPCLTTSRAAFFEPRENARGGCHESGCFCIGYPEWYSTPDHFIVIVYYAVVALASMTVIAFVHVCGCGCGCEDMSDKQAASKYEMWAALLALFPTTVILTTSLIWSDLNDPNAENPSTMAIASVVYALLTSMFYIGKAFGCCICSCSHQLFLLGMPISRPEWQMNRIYCCGFVGSPQKLFKDTVDQKLLELLPRRWCICPCVHVDNKLECVCCLAGLELIDSSSSVSNPAFE